AYRPGRDLPAVRGPRYGGAAVADTELPTADPGSLRRSGPVHAPSPLLPGLRAAGAVNVGGAVEAMSALICPWCGKVYETHEGQICPVLDNSLTRMIAAATQLVIRERDENARQ